MNTLWHGVRVLARKPGFTAAAVMVLALGIGANAAIFSLINAFLLKPLAIHKPEELAGLYSRNTTNANYRAFSYPNYVDLRAQNGVFTSLAAHNAALVGLTEGDTTRRVFADLVSSNYFETMGVSLVRGRVFTAEEERPGSGIPVAIASYAFWKRHGADPGMMGRQLRVNGKSFTIIGITPEGFTGYTALMSSELYLPLGMYESLINDFEGHNRAIAARDHHTLIPVGRLRPGMTPAAADAQLVATASAMRKAWPVENKDQTLLVRPLSRMSISDSPETRSGMGVTAVLLLSMASVVLLIAALNVANMMLARGAARRKEIAIRLALGGGRRDIIRQLLSESLILALLGGAAGLVIAWWSTGLLVSSMARMAPIDIVYNAAPDVRVLAATFGFCLAATLLFGFMPAWNLSRPDLTTALKSGERGLGGHARLFSRGNLLVMGQICLSLTLLTAAGLFIQSAVRAAGVAPGFRTANSLVVEIDPSLAGYDPTRGREVYRSLLTRLRGLPGVESASIAATVPFGMISLGRGVQRTTDDRADKRTQVECRSNIVDAEYFRTMGIPLLRGRSFLPGEAAAGSAVVLDRMAAERLWPHGEALGKHLRLTGADEREVEVVGVAGDVQEHTITQEASPHVYLPFGKEYQADMNFHLKTGAGTGAIEAVRREIRGYDAALPVLAVRTMEQHMEASFDFWIARTGAVLFSIFGGVALLLAVIGLYGIRSYAVARRTREIGIRMALGADSSDALRLVLREGVLLTATGAAAGLVLSLVLGKMLAGLLYQVSAVDPVVMLGAPAILSAVSLLACYVPARRASRVDPMVALRYE